MAVIGRQKLNQFFASQTAIVESASATLRSAKIRAFCVIDRSCDIASDSAVRFQSVATVSNVPCQNRAMSACSGVTVALFPSALTCARSSRYSGLVNDGRANGRNCDGELIVHGVIAAYCRKTGFTIVGCGCQSPACKPGT